jgi:glycosyltransferase involved in cell wall biosynthesis
MHIVHCLTHSDIGGGQEMVFTLVKSLMVQHPDKKITIVLPSGGLYIERFKYLSANIVEAPFDRISIITLLRSYFLFRKLKPDILHSHGKGAGFYARFFARSLRNAGRIHTYHGFQPPESTLQKALYLALERFLIRNTDALIAVSNSEAIELQRTFHRSAEKIKELPNVVDFDEIDLRSKDNISKDIEVFLNSNQDSFIVTMIARNDPVKNYGLACEAARLALSRTCSFAFVFVGINPEDVAIQNLTRDFPGSVLAPGLVKNPSAIVARSHAMMLTSRKEGGLPLVLQEGFCLGKPAIGTNVPGIADLVVNRVNGLLCGEEAEQLATALQELQKNTALYNALQKGALATAERFDIPAWTKIYYELYTSLCA